MSTLEYNALRRKAVVEKLEKFPDVPNKTLGRMIKKDNPELFRDDEEGRDWVRRYRGAHGKDHRERLKFTKYYKNVELA
jgi:hypothetical protein